MKLPLAVLTKQLLDTLRADKAIVVQAPKDLLSHAAIMNNNNNNRLLQ